MPKHNVLAVLEPNNSGFEIYFPAFPIPRVFGSTFDQAINNGANELVRRLQNTSDEGDFSAGPVPTIQQTYDANPTVFKAGVLSASIEIDFPGRSLRVNVSIEEGLLRDADLAAKTRGQSRSAFIASALRAHM